VARGRALNPRFARSGWRKRWKRLSLLPPEEQDAIASQILASLADEEAWKKSYVEKRDVIRRMGREALQEDELGETRSLGDVL
jgi:hypothetical protein